MKNTIPTEKEILKGQLNEEEKSTLSRAGIRVHQGLPRAYYLKAILGKIHALIEVLYPTALTSEPQDLQDIDMEVVIWSWRAEQHRPTWATSLKLLEDVLDYEGTQSAQAAAALARTKSAPLTWYSSRPKDYKKRPPTKHGDLFTALGLDGRSSAVFFMEYRKYNGGIFHESTERTLFEYFLMLQSQYITPENPEVWRSYKVITEETGVPEHSIGTFLNKAKAAGFIRWVRKGSLFKNHYSLDLEMIKASLDLIYPPSAVEPGH